MRTLRLLVLLLLAAESLVVWAIPASAHDKLIGSDPAAGSTVTVLPAAVRLYFEEPPVTGYTTVSVRDPHGKQLRSSGVISAGSTISVRIREVHVLGTYRVDYHVLSDDGHAVNGTVQFVLGGAARSEPVTARHHGKGASLAPLVVALVTLAVVTAMLALTAQRRTARRRAALTSRR